MAHEEFMLQSIYGIREKDPSIGGMELWYLYWREFGRSHPVGRDRFEDIVDKYDLKVRRRVRKVLQSFDCVGNYILYMQYPCECCPFIKTFSYICEAIRS